MPATLDERELVRRSLAGDREAFRIIVLRHQRELANTIYRLTGDRSATEDLVQETFLRAYRALDRFDPRYRLATWLRSIALNVTRDRGRRERVRSEHLPRLQARAAAERCEPPPPPEAAARKEVLGAVLDALAHLTPEQREAVVLSVFDGLTQREVAEVLGAPLGTVKTRLRSAYRRLRDLVAPLRPGGAP
ncbi:MAG: sigma-70 family RNA polymerase sigma factor [Planctomycetota bacterium]|nr:MAG: sigma-70 family RNA polymerase sigma factor [Planctomycetota bacterium]